MNCVHGISFSQPCSLCATENKGEVRSFIASSQPPDLVERVAMIAAADDEKEWRESSEDWREHWRNRARRILREVGTDGVKEAFAILKKAVIDWDHEETTAHNKLWEALNRADALTPPSVGKEKT